LQQLRSKLRNHGILFIQVPNAEANPFDYVVADHLLHFNPHTLSVLLRRAGFARIQIFTDWVMKEISAIVRLEGDDAEPVGGSPPHVDIRQTLAQISWLNTVVTSARRAAAA